MTRSPILSTLVSLALGGLLWIGLPCSVQGQTLDDVMRYSAQSPTSGGPVAGRAGAGLSAGLAAPYALFGNPAGLGWLSSSMWSGDFAANRTGSNTRFSTPDANASADRMVSEYRLGSLAGAYSFPTTQGSLVIGASFHQSGIYGREFDVAATNSTNSITGAFLPPRGFQLDNMGEEEITFNDILSSLDGFLPGLAFEAGAIDFSRSVYNNRNYPFFQGSNPQASATDGQMTLEQQENLTESGQMNELSFGAATAIAPNVMLGGGLNVTFGSYTFERFYRETEVSGLLPPENLQDPQRPYDPYFVVDSTSTPALILEGFNELQLEDRIEADLSGVNFRFGLSAEPTGALRVGIHVNSPTWLKVDEVFGTEMRTQFDCNFSLNTPCPQGGVEGFASGNLTGNEFSYDIRTPWRFGTGFRYSSNGLTLAGGLKYIDWTQAEVEANSDGQIGRNVQMLILRLNRAIQRLDVTFNTRLGAEYAFDDIALRAGLSYHPDPRRRSFEGVGGDFTDGDRLFLSTGISVSISGNSTLHLNWVQERFDDRHLSYTTDGLFTSGAPPTVREALQRNRVLIGLTYRP